MIPKLPKDEPSLPEEVILKLTIAFPREVDIATTPYINSKNGNMEYYKRNAIQGSCFEGYY